MMKRVVALVLCLASVLFCFTACSNGENDKGAYIRMYLTEPVYDLDPLNAFDNEAALQLTSMIFENLFYADDNGKPQKGLVDDYKYVENEEEGEYTLTLHFKDTKWSDGVPVTAKHAQYSFLRLLSTDVSHPAAVLLYDIKNARAIAEGNDSIGHLGITYISNTELEIAFEGPINLDEFLLNLTSPVLAPMRDDVIEANKNWAKKGGSSMPASGPFMVRSMDFTAKDGFILERNSYHYRDRSKDDLDKFVKPYRIVVNYLVDAAAQLGKFNSEEAGALYYFGRIPLSARKNGEFSALLEDVKVSNAASTHTYYLNQNAVIANGGEGEKLFAKAEVRKALSLAIDRQAIVDAIVYAAAAEGLVPYTMLETPGKKTEFRKKAESFISSSANVAEAKKLLSAAGVTNPGQYSFSITVFQGDEDHVAMARLVASAWSGLGFKVDVKTVGVSEITEMVEDDNGNLVEQATGMYNNLYRDALQSGDFEVIALDLVATSPDTFSYLAPFALAFSGNAINWNSEENPEYALTPHITGYNSEAYNAKIEEIYNATNKKDRARLLHEAEAILMEDMPAIPIVFNQDVALKSKKLSGIDSNFFCNSFLTETKLSGYWKIALRDQFVEEEEEYEEAV